MARNNIIVYLLIVALTPILWLPIMPALYALNYREAPLAAKFLEKKPRYVYFGDSVLYSYTVCEADHRTVIDLLPKEIAGRTVGFNYGGANASLWRTTARFIAARGNGSVSAAILPINMEVFALGWEHQPFYSFEQSISNFGDTIHIR